MPYLLGLRGEIQPAYYIFPEGIPPTMSQPSFSLFNFSLKKIKVAATEMNGAQCVPAYIHRPMGKWALQLNHICDLSTEVSKSWIKMGQSNILWQIFFPLRKWQDLKSIHGSSKSGKLIKAVLRRAAGLVKPVKCKLHLPVTLPTLWYS